jgi:hypothetical protein
MAFINVANVALALIRRGLQKIQSKLAFDDWEEYPQFATKTVRPKTFVVLPLLSLLLANAARMFV